MTPRILITTAAVGAAFALAVPAAWGSEPYRDRGDAADAKLALQSSPQVVIRDHGDATQAKLTWQSAPVVARERAQRAPRQSPSTVVRDHGDATQAMLAAQAPDSSPVGQVETSFRWDINWSQVGIGIGIGAGMVFIVGLILAVRFSRNQRLAH